MDKVLATDKGAEYLVFVVFSFPRNERKIYKLRQLTWSQFVYFLRTEPSMFTFTKEYEGTRGYKNQIFHTKVPVMDKIPAMDIPIPTAIANRNQLKLAITMCRQMKGNMLFC